MIEFDRESETFVEDILDKRGFQGTVKKFKDLETTIKFLETIRMDGREEGW